MKWYEDKIYILMCRTAYEIQKKWRPKAGDFVHDKDYKILRHAIAIVGDCGKWEIHSSEAWLPRQDQLQEMIDLAMFDKMSAFRNFVFKDTIKIYPDLLMTEEQYWLAFVMKEKYNKIWTGENWEIKK